MDRKAALLAAAGLAATVLFVAFSAAVKDTETIWLQTRLFGLLSYAFLFAAVLIGEIRALAIKKSDFPLFRLHKPIAIFAVYLVLLHFVSAFADNYKWGKQLRWTDYLGVSFSDKWLTLLSFGVLAFYLMVLVSATSATRSMQWLGCGRWKAVHYLSYAAYFIAYVHSVNLGTDVKTSILSPVIRPLMRLTFIIAISLLITRALKGLNILKDQLEVVLAAAFFITLVLSATALISHHVAASDMALTIEKDLNATREDVGLQEADNARLREEVQVLLAQITGVTNGRTG
jgi:methionine sulfoxide reductase heme-binding subunit